MKLLRPKATAEAMGISLVTLWRRAKAEDFPRPFRVGRQAIAWDEAEILAWLETRRISRPSA